MTDRDDLERLAMTFSEDVEQLATLLEDVVEDVKLELSAANRAELASALRRAAEPSWGSRTCFLSSSDR